MSWNYSVNGAYGAATIEVGAEFAFFSTRRLARGR